MSDEEHGQQEALRDACSRVSADAAIDFAHDVRGTEDLRAEVERLRDALARIENLSYSVSGDAESDLQRCKELARAALGGPK